MYRLNFILLLCIISTLSKAQQANRAIINGQITGLNQEKVYLTNRGFVSNASFNKFIYDSAISTTDGKFAFKLNNFDNSSFYCIELDSITKGWIPLLLNNNEQVKINASLGKYISQRKISGSRDDSLRHSLSQKENTIIFIGNAAADSSSAALVRRNQELSNHYDSINKLYMDSVIKIETDFIKLYPRDILSLKLLASNQYSINRSSLRELLSILEPRFKKDSLFQFLNAYAETKCMIEIGKVAPPLTNLIDIYDNKDFSIINYKGKYLLLDFWASWCAPCRAQIPELKNIYDSTNRNKIDFVSISIDQNIEDWKTAAKEENTPWLTLLAKGGIRNKSIINYNMDAIPKYVLISPIGNILSIFPNMEMLKKKIGELFNDSN